ncbi:hypothetical protein [Amaricoccus macauensis]|uniref:hypothetical protein n=1 Tax=Amaricoccus macauensis TaxID=57001 RepID=UPI003C79AEFA
MAGAAPELTGAAGPGPFVTRRHYLHGGAARIWRSRDHRRGLRRAYRPLRDGTWKPEVLNVWIGWGFAFGSLLFVLGSVLSLAPSLVPGLDAGQANAVYFIGSIFFTVAAYLQLFQAANAGPLPDENHPPGERVLIGWQPREIGWLSCFLQFIGTLLFNLSTFAALASVSGWFWQELSVWVPDVLGSVLFLASGYLAFIEACHRFLAWKPGDLSWWVVSANLMGCIAFMISAVYAFIPETTVEEINGTASVAWCLIGAAGFLAGSLLMLMEGRKAETQTALAPAA